MSCPEFMNNLLILIILCVVLITLNGLILTLHSYSLAHTLRSIQESLKLLKNTITLFDKILKRQQSQLQSHIQNTDNVLEVAKERLADWVSENNIECV